MADGVDDGGKVGRRRHDGLEIRFTHEPLSVFRDFDAFVKAPTFVPDDG